MSRWSLRCYSSWLWLNPLMFPEHLFVRNPPLQAVYYSGDPPTSASENSRPPISSQRILETLFLGGFGEGDWWQQIHGSKTLSFAFYFGSGLKRKHLCVFSMFGPAASTLRHRCSSVRPAGRFPPRCHLSGSPYSTNNHEPERRRKPPSSQTVRGGSKITVQGFVYSFTCFTFMKKLRSDWLQGRNFRAMKKLNRSELTLTTDTLQTQPPRVLGGCQTLLNIYSWGSS